MAREFMSGEIHNQKMVEVLKSWVSETTFGESTIEQVVGEFGSILRLSQTDEDYILENEGV